jgi:small subunit ribosomal protein S18
MKNNSHVSCKTLISKNVFLDKNSNLATVNSLLFSNSTLSSVNFCPSAIKTIIIQSPRLQSLCRSASFGSFSAPGTFFKVNFAGVRLYSSNKNDGIKTSSLRRVYRNCLQEKREKALKAFLLEKRLKRNPSFASRKNQKRTLPLIPPKSLFILIKSKNKVYYDRKFIDYKNRNLLQQYIRFDGQILPKRKTKITTKQQRYLTKAIKTARILGFLPFVKKESGFFR